MLLDRLKNAIAWRWDMAKRRLYLHRTFRNGEELFQSYITRVPCDQAVCQDGTVIRHPTGRTGLAQMILEVWYENVYTRAFYKPQTGDAVIDAGANIGLFSLSLARRHPKCQILALEPFEENFRLLQANLESACVSNVRTFQIGLAGHTGHGRMRDGGARSQDHRLSAALESDPSGSVVQTIGFNDMLSMATTDRIALFKCDIEGSEQELFCQARDDDIKRVSRYAIEYHDNICPGTLKVLRERLGVTHNLIINPDGKLGFGMLYALLKTAY
jgi:FkbM family methyltransferase